MSPPVLHFASRPLKTVTNVEAHCPRVLFKLETARFSRPYATVETPARPLLRHERVLSTAGAKIATSRLEHAPALTALHNVRGLLPRVLSPDSPGLAFWDNVLRSVSEEISGPAHLGQRTFSVVVLAADEYAGDAALVEAILGDPFSSDQECDRVQRRWDGREDLGRLDIENNPTDKATLQLSSSFLTAHAEPIRMTELRSSSAPPSPDRLQTLYTADVPMLLINPLTTPISSLSHRVPYPLPPHTLILISSPSPTSTPASLRSQIADILSLPFDNVLFVDPERAKTASQTLRAAPSDALHVQRYHDDALGSGLSVLRRAITAVLAPPATSPSTSYAPARKADALLRASVSMMRAELDRAEHELHVAAQTIYALRGAIAEVRGEAEKGVLGAHSERVSVDSGKKEMLSIQAEREGDDEDKIAMGFAHADEMVRPTLSNLGWVTVLGSGDEVAWSVKQSLRGAWVGGVERTILPALSPLRRAQTHLSSTTLSRVASLPPSLRSSVLLNTLQQITRSPTFPLSPTRMLSPLSQRMKRMDEGPTAKLGRAAQGLFLRVCGSLGAGAGVGGIWVGWGSGAALVTGGATAEVGTAVGVGMLVCLGGVRWAVGKWDRARKAWLADWTRMREGAARDVQTSFDHAMEAQVLAVPLRACDGIDALVTKRRDEVDQLKAEVSKIEKSMFFIA
ncbi:hypothetical protein OF83DRAFT_1169057 [Amylostereum chailletii]|nr:hypothetical protein OF83DRAFT_1169057 [Amylostereum chailletii]